MGDALGDAGDPDVPGDMAGQFVLGQAEIAEHARDRAAVVVAGEKEGRGAIDIQFENGIDLVGREAQVGFGQVVQRHISLSPAWMHRP